MFPRLEMLLAPINQAIGKSENFEMTPTCIENYEKIKKLAKNGIGVKHMRYEKTMFIADDTSMTGIGGVLGYADEISEVDGKVKMTGMNIVSYVSRPLMFEECILSSRSREIIGLSWTVMELQDYLIEEKMFYAITDHKSLMDADHRCLYTSNATRIRKAVANLLEYPKMEVVYASAEEDIMILVDGMSRNQSYEFIRGDLDLGGTQLKKMRAMKIQLNNISKLKEICDQNADYDKINLERIIEEQVKDDYCKQLIDQISNNNGKKVLKGKSEFIYQNSALYRINSKCITEIVIPKNLASELVEFIHYSTFHTGKSRLTYFVNSNNIYFQDKSKIINQTVDCCVTCAWIHPKRMEQNNSVIRPALEPLKDFCVDLIDFSKHSESRIKYYLIVIDKFSLYADGVPLINKTANEVAKALAKLIHKYNMYAVHVLSDNGLEFKNRTMQQLFRKYSIAGTYISPYNARANRVERVNKEI